MTPVPVPPPEIRAATRLHIQSRANIDGSTVYNVKAVGLPGKERIMYLGRAETQEEAATMYARWVADGTRSVGKARGTKRKAVATAAALRKRKGTDRRRALAEAPAKVQRSETFRQQRMNAIRIAHARVYGAY